MHLLKVGTLRDYLQWEFAELTGREQSPYGDTDAYEGRHKGGASKAAADNAQVCNNFVQFLNTKTVKPN